MAIPSLTKIAPTIHLISVTNAPPQVVCASLTWAAFREGRADARFGCVLGYALAPIDTHCRVAPMDERLSISASASELQAPPDYTTDPLPWRNLAAAIVEQGVWDYRAVAARGGMEAMRAAALGRSKQPYGQRNAGRVSRIEDAMSAVTFIEGTACEALCEFVGVEVAGVRDQLCKEATCKVLDPALAGNHSIYSHSSRVALALPT